MDLVQFGEYIRSLRKKRGLTITKLAELSGVSHPYLSQIENGKKKNFPSSDVLIKLAGPLGVDHTDLMEKAGYLLREEVNKDFRTQLSTMLEETLAVTTINNQFLDFLSDDINRLEQEYGNHLDEGERITPEWLRNLVSNADWRQEWIWNIVKHVWIIAKKHDLDFEEIARKRMLEQQREKELKDILNFPGITYNSHPLDEDDRKRILDMLAVLFPDLK